ncbi:hypothetical protein F0562_010693 [Nyssa sinensis]|uniref:Uncharacterized protein n=1 Tax=Nyssa sinensis TaxID=561372 RepID=A0A5J5A1E9_9ASTE|nr:hypothetical protein F0562_010693 [Nyssa sinensis]
MITMDFQGVTWVGNMYQKFETMCLEMEEEMYQDTVKYVENEVRMVGASVKKFYSDVLQDLLLPASIDPTKAAAAADLSLNPYVDVGVYKKPKPSMKEEPIKIDKLIAEDSRVISGVVADQTSSLSGFHDVNHSPPSFSGGSAKGASSELYLGQNKDGGMYEHSNVGVKINSRNNNYPPSELSRSITLVSKDSSRVSSCCEIRVNQEAACNQITMMLPLASVDVTRSDSGGAEGKICNNTMGTTASTTAASIDFPVSEMILAAESREKKGTKLRGTSCSGGSGGLSAESNGRSGDCNRDVIENNNTLAVMETIDDKSKLEETCVLVDGDELLVSQQEGKRQSYKKKFRKALSSRMRSARKQEYEQLVERYGDIDSESNQESAESSMPTLSMDAKNNNLPGPDFCESEWELL